MALGLAVLAWIAMNLPWAVVWESMHEVRLQWIAVSLVVGTAGITVRAFRLKAVLGKTEAGGIKPVWRSVTLGYFASLAFPFGGGEVIKMAALNRFTRIPASRAVAAVTMDRLFDAGTLVLLAFLVSYTHAVPGLRPGPLFLLGAAFSLASATVALLMLRGESLGRLLGRLPWPQRHLERLLQGYESIHQQALRLRQPGLWLTLGTLQFSAFALDTFGAWCGLHAFPFSSQLGMNAAIQLNLLIMVAFALPLLPGSLGTLQGAYVLALRPFGIGTAESLAFSLVGQAGHMVLVATLGLASLSSSGLGISGLRRWGRSAAKP
jgi:uncharacterized membrane protein YbhN (UPF0104 family)